MMPPANQDISPGQQYPLSTDRVQSTIPKGGTDGTWSYPSPQMFYNALMRKNKGENVEESDVATIVAIHNNMNEKAWQQVMEYESTVIQTLQRTASCSNSLEDQMNSHPL